MLREKMIAEASGQMVGKMDDEIRAALNQFWPVWTLEDVKRRCRIARIAGSPVETLCADGIPLLEMHPVESTMERTADSYVIRYTRRFRRLSPQPGASKP